MPTFIDESGDTGPIAQGGKTYFRLAAVWVPSLEHADAFRELVRGVRARLGLRPDYEFKFARTHPAPDRRRAFFEAALSLEFRFAVSSIDKTREPGAGWSGPEQHRACATELAALLRRTYCHAEAAHGGSFREQVVVDDNSDKDFLDAIKQQFRALRPPDRPTSCLVGKVAFRKSSADELLQLVDMVCGAAGARLNGEDRSWYDLIAHRDLTF